MARAASADRLNLPIIGSRFQESAANPLQWKSEIGGGMGTKVDFPKDSTRQIDQKPIPESSALLSGRGQANSSGIDLMHLEW